MSDLMNALTSAIADAAPDAPLRRRMGTVTAINANRTLSVTIGGSTTAITGVHYFGHYAPKVGAQVWLDTDGRDWVAVGAIAGSGGAVPSCKVYRTADLSVATGATFVTVPWQAVEFDPWGMWTSGSNVVAPITGRYLVTAQVQMNALSPYTATYRTGRIYKNGVALNIAQQDSATGNVQVGFHLSTVVTTTSGDYFTLGVRQNSGTTYTALAGTGAFESHMTVTYLGPDA